MAVTVAAVTTLNSIAVVSNVAAAVVVDVAAVLLN
jgi:hypothetical protein